MYVPPNDAVPSSTVPVPATSTIPSLWLALASATLAPSSCVCWPSPLQLGSRSPDAACAAPVETIESAAAAVIIAAIREPCVASRDQNIGGLREPNECRWAVGRDPVRARLQAA